MNGRFRALGVDYSALALGNCRSRVPTGLAQAAVASLPFASETFGLVTCFDVLYHRAVVDELAALRECHRVLQPGGWLLVRVPAYRWLWSDHDDLEHAARRYTRRSVQVLLEKTSFSVRRATYCNSLAFPLAAVRRVWRRWSAPQPQCDLQPIAAPLNQALLALLTLEAKLIQKANLPFGLSVIALAQKPQ